METLVIVIHLLVALAIIGLILMQQGKGAEAGASFGGGASQTVFGSQGGSNFFAKVTGVLAFIFFATSFSLAIVAKNKVDIGIDLGISEAALEQSAVESELPEATEGTTTLAELPEGIPVEVPEEVSTSQLDSIKEETLESVAPEVEVPSAQESEVKAPDLEVKPQ